LQQDHRAETTFGAVKSGFGECCGSGGSVRRRDAAAPQAHEQNRQADTLTTEFGLIQADGAHFTVLSGTRQPGVHASQTGGPGEFGTPPNQRDDLGVEFLDRCTQFVTVSVGPNCRRLRDAHHFDPCLGFRWRFVSAFESQFCSGHDGPDRHPGWHEIDTIAAAGISAPKRLGQKPTARPHP
jgi:hypothetical protein